MPFTFEHCKIPEIILIKPKVYSDSRGFFMEIFKNVDFQQIGITQPIVQINKSRSAKNVSRGMHFQLHPYSQGKIVTVVHGEIFDVAVDIRP